jgi:hypothetical protein
MRKAFISPRNTCNARRPERLGSYVDCTCIRAPIAHRDDAARVKAQLDFTAEKNGVRCRLGLRRRMFAPGNRAPQGYRREGELRRRYRPRRRQGDRYRKMRRGQRETVIICPTIAATDAPTSSSAVLLHAGRRVRRLCLFHRQPERRARRHGSHRDGTGEVSRVRHGRRPLDVLRGAVVPARVRGSTRADTPPGRGRDEGPMALAHSATKPCSRTG